MVGSISDPPPGSVPLADWSASLAPADAADDSVKTVEIIEGELVAGYHHWAVRVGKVQVEIGYGGMSQPGVLNGVFVTPTAMAMERKHAVIVLRHTPACFSAIARRKNRRPHMRDFRPGCTCDQRISLTTRRPYAAIASYAQAFLKANPTYVLVAENCQCFAKGLVEHLAGEQLDQDHPVPISTESGSIVPLVAGIGAVALMAWLVPVTSLVTGAGLLFVLVANHFDPERDAIEKTKKEMGAGT